MNLIVSTFDVERQTTVRIPFGKVRLQLRKLDQDDWLYLADVDKLCFFLLDLMIERALGFKARLIVQ